MKSYQLIWRMIRFQPRVYILNCLIWISINFIKLLPGLLAQWFFDTLTGKAHASVGLWGILVLLVMVAVGRLVMVLIGAYCDTYNRFTMSALLRRNMLKWMLKQPSIYHSAHSTGHILSQFRDDTKQAENSISWFVDVIGMASFTLFAFIILFHINFYVTCFVFSPLIFIVLIAHICSSYIERYRALSRASTADVTGAIGEMFETVQAIQNAGAEERVIEHLRQLSAKRRDVALKDTILSQIMNSVFANIGDLGTGLILLTAAHLLSSGSFTIGNFALFVSYLDFVTDSTVFFGKFLTDYKQTKVSFERIMAMFKGASPEVLVQNESLYLSGLLPPVIAPVKDELTSLKSLEFLHLTYQYPQAACGIENISLRLQSGSFTVITGRVGSGKTTLLRTMLGLLPMMAGEIRWNGQSIQEPASFFMPPRSAYTPQIPKLFSQSLQDNILLGLSREDVSLSDILHLAVMEHDVATLENGLDTMIGPRGVKLSGGQVQRTAVARMFARNAELLVIDDLSSALDVETEQRLWERLFRQRNVTCVVVSHRHAAFKRADHIILLKDGHLEAEGSLDHLLATNEEMQNVWRQYKSS